VPASRGGWLWLLPLGLFGYALMLTHSRGGLLALMGGILGFTVARWGWQRAAIVAAVGLPLLLMLFAGRQTAMSLTDGGDTAQARIQLWSQGMAMFRASPVLGIGQNQFVEQAGQVAHNSFVQSYTELGLLGGTLFLGLFYASARPLWRASREGGGLQEQENGTLRRLNPYMMAILCAYAVGLLSLSRGYVVPTFLVLGMMAVHARLAARDAGTGMERFDLRLIGRVALASVVFLVCIYLFIRAFVRW
jgi:putative inorganic carbon (hco3(-)) transporter